MRNKKNLTSFFKWKKIKDSLINNIRHSKLKFYLTLLIF